MEILKKLLCWAGFLTLVALPVRAESDQWYFPMNRYAERITVKSFGTLIDEAFYQGKENLFPFNRFSGYHAGVDLETLSSDSALVPVYTVAKGKVTYIGTLSGYGGVILVALEGENRTALYGHVKITGLPFKTDDEVEAGEVLTYLGDAFSAETSKERKHLHFGIYKRVDRYFRGHEPSRAVLNSKWVEPTVYLQNKGAIDPAPQYPPIPTHAPSERSREDVGVRETTKPGIVYTVIQWLRSLIERFVK